MYSNHKRQKLSPNGQYITQNKNNNNLINNDNNNILQVEVLQQLGNNNQQINPQLTHYINTCFDNKVTHITSIQQTLKNISKYVSNNNNINNLDSLLHFTNILFKSINNIDNNNQINDILYKIIIKQIVNLTNDISIIDVLNSNNVVILYNIFVNSKKFQSVYIRYIETKLNNNIDEDNYRILLSHIYLLCCIIIHSQHNTHSNDISNSILHIMYRVYNNIDNIGMHRNYILYHIDILCYITCILCNTHTIYSVIQTLNNLYNVINNNVYNALRYMNMSVKQLLADTIERATKTSITTQFIQLIRQSIEQYNNNNNDDTIQQQHNIPTNRFETLMIQSINESGYQIDHFITTEQIIQNNQLLVQQQLQQQTNNNDNNNNNNVNNTTTHNVNTVLMQQQQQQLQHNNDTQQLPHISLKSRYTVQQLLKHRNNIINQLNHVTLTILNNNSVVLSNPIQTNYHRQQLTRIYRRLNKLYHMHGQKYMILKPCCFPGFYDINSKNISNNNNNNNNTNVITQQQQSQVCYITNLSDDILTYICKYLYPSELIHLSYVNKTIYNITTSNNIWLNIIKQTFGDIDTSKCVHINNVLKRQHNYYDIYKRRVISYISSLCDISNNVYLCTICRCNQSFTTEYALKQHQLTAHRTIVNPPATNSTIQKNSTRKPGRPPKKQKLNIQQQQHNNNDNNNNNNDSIQQLHEQQQDTILPYINDNNNNKNNNITDSYDYNHNTSNTDIHITAIDDTEPSLYSLQSSEDQQQQDYINLIDNDFSTESLTIGSANKYRLYNKKSNTNKRKKRQYDSSNHRNQSIEPYKCIFDNCDCVFVSKKYLRDHIQEHYNIVNRTSFLKHVVNKYKTQIQDMLSNQQQTVKIETQD